MSGGNGWYGPLTGGGGIWATRKRWKAGKRGYLKMPSLGLPYLQKCAAPSVFGDPPSGLPRFDKGVNVSISGGGGGVLGGAGGV